MPSRKTRSRGPSAASRLAAYLITVLIVAASVAICFLYAYNMVPQQFVLVNLSITTSLFFPSIVFSYLLHKGRGIRQIISELGLARQSLSLRNLAIGILIFIAILGLSAAFGLLTAVTGIQFPTNVNILLSGMPIYFLAFASIIAPFNEEVFFRGFLVNRIGILLSSIIFAFLHAGYSSISELIAAFIFGLIASYIFRRTKSLYPSLLAHILVNVLAVLSLQ